jgi:probable LLM family oxidoreductase
MAQTIELGLDTFGDVTAGPDGQPLSQAQSIRNLVLQAELADQVGLAFIGVGEHHRPDFSVSAPEVVLAAIASRTTRIHLGSAVTVLSSDDPVRVFERFSTLNALSNGRAEVIVGRGSFTESFPLFGYDLQNYEELFEEHLNLFAELLKQEAVTWTGRLRAGLTNQLVYPPSEGPLYTWVGVGGSPESVVRAAYYGLPMMLAIIGGSPARFAPYSQLYRERLEKFGKPPQPIGAHSPGHVAETDEQAKDELWPHYAGLMNRIGRERGWPPSGEREYAALRSPRGALAAGSPDEVAEKLLYEHELFGHQRYIAQMSVGAVAHADVLRSMELFGTEVAPVVRAEVARREAPAPVV